MKKHSNTILIFLLAGLCGFLIWNSLKPNQELANLRAKLEQKEGKVISLQISYETTLKQLQIQREVSDSLFADIEKRRREYNLISDKYERLRKNLRNYTIDEHIEFFSDWTEAFGN